MVPPVPSARSTSGRPASTSREALARMRSASEPSPAPGPPRMRREKCVAPRVGLMRAETRVRPRLRQRPRGIERGAVCAGGRDAIESRQEADGRFGSFEETRRSPRRVDGLEAHFVPRDDARSSRGTRRDAMARANARARPPRLRLRASRLRLRTRASSIPPHLLRAALRLLPRSFATREAALTTPLSPEDRRDRRATPLLSYRIFSHNASTHVTWSSATPGTRA